MLGRIGHVMASALDREMNKFGIRTLHLGLMSAVRSFGPLSQQRIAEFSAPTEHRWPPWSMTSRRRDSLSAVPFSATAAFEPSH
ncbi:hypothetical protein EAH80_14820 [Mycobacterium hodleri]|uniref:Uncharacterized protein n=1 Tax=Mycolicibacterium hodleri TaxID=49897 RepID=A0A502E859_9MYCO|nr:hypothetical protein EAH80_14820 [Mycolicibacterium hodleri]